MCVNIKRSHMRKKKCGSNIVKAGGGKSFYNLYHIARTDEYYNINTIRANCNKNVIRLLLT